MPGPENKELNVLIAAIGPIPGLMVQPCNSDDLRHRVTQTELVDVDAFIRDGYVVVRGAFDVGIAAACRAVIWDSMSGQGVREDDPATWPPLVEFDDLVGEPFTAAGTSPALAGISMIPPVWGHQALAVIGHGDPCALLG